MVNQKLVLDTHIWLWMMENNPSLSLTAKKILEKTALQNGLLLPSICVWELTALEKSGRISLSISIRTWLDKALSTPGITLIPLNADIAFEACYLPGTFHKDPADRMIVATGRIESASIVTRDQKILDYGKTGHVHVVAA